MTAALPVRKMSHPADLDGCTNGVINPAVHVAVALADGTRSTMHHLAARALLSLDAALLAATGLRIGSIGMWRPYAVQETGFRRSYLDHYDPARCTLDHQRVWKGRTWFLLEHTTPKAVPGTSEHGWGLANDTTLVRSGIEYAIGDRRVAAGFTFLVAHAVEHGFSWAYKKPGVDDPHLQYFAGDRLPAAVLATPAPAPAPATAVPPPTVRAGSRGANVEALQRVLIARRLYPATGVDGIAGPRTVAAIRALQTELGFTGRDVDGIYGPATAGRLAAHPMSKLPGAAG